MRAMAGWKFGKKNFSSARNEISQGADSMGIVLLCLGASTQPSFGRETCFIGRFVRAFAGRPITTHFYALYSRSRPHILQ